MHNDTIQQVFATIKHRQTQGDPKHSWTAKLLADGTEKICKKLGEETTETIIGAIKKDTDNVIYESADVLYHLMVLWADQGITPDQVLQELARRQGISGISEKKQRTK